MKKSTGIAFVCCMAFLVLVMPSTILAEVSRVNVSAHAAITEGDVARAQREALDAALEKGIKEVLGQVIPERTYEILESLLKQRVLPKTELFITNYQIVEQDVSDLALTVDVSVTVDTDLLRKNLAQLGVIKEPGSPPLTAQFITVEAPLGLKHVKTLGISAQDAVGSVLGHSNFIVIPPPEDDELGFRVIRPPQAPEALGSEGLMVLADLAVGILFRKNGETVISGNTMKIPMTLFLQAVDVRTGTLLGVDIQDMDILLGTKDGTLLSKDLGNTLNKMAGRLSLKLREHYHAAEKTRLPIKLIFEGRHQSRTVRNVLGELVFRLDETASVIPERFMESRSVYVVWSDREKSDIIRILSSVRSVREYFNIMEHEEGVVLTGKGGPSEQGVREFGEEVTFYRRLPVPGVENPDDIRKIEYVGWQEQEYNSDVASANAAPIGMGILGRIDPSRDHDIYRFRIPEGVTDISVLVEQSGPGEVQPMVRVFTGDGRLVTERIARSRGRNIYFTIALETGITEILVSVEDHLGRYSSMFPYVLTLGAQENGKPDEPS
jgi:hypothetical protein